MNLEIIYHFQIEANYSAVMQMAAIERIELAPVGGLFNGFSVFVIRWSALEGKIQNGNETTKIIELCFKSESKGDGIS